MLSVRTNSAAIAAAQSLQSATNRSGALARQLATGHRINSAQDDAAGLQIAQRLEAQASGLTVAIRNTQNTISLFQAADAVVGNILDTVVRMKDLATQAADISSSAQDKEALGAEFTELYYHYIRLWGTEYGGENLFGGGGLPGQHVVFPVALHAQVGDAASDAITIDLSWTLQDATQSFMYDTQPGPQNVERMLPEHASRAIGDMTTAIANWSTFRSALGAGANMLEHAQANAINMHQSTKAALGRITDVDYAMATAESTRAQVLAQSSTAMLKQSASSVQLVLSLIQS